MRVAIDTRQARQRLLRYKVSSSFERFTLLVIETAALRAPFIITSASHVSRWIGAVDGVIIHIRIVIQALRVVEIGDDGIGGDEAAETNFNEILALLVLLPKNSQPESYPLIGCYICC